MCAGDTFLRCRSYAFAFAGTQPAVWRGRADRIVLGDEGRSNVGTVRELRRSCTCTHTHARGGKSRVSFELGRERNDGVSLFLCL